MQKECRHCLIHTFFKECSIRKLIYKCDLMHFFQILDSSAGTRLKKHTKEESLSVPVLH